MTSNNPVNKYLVLIVMIYVTIMLTNIVFAYKIVHIGSLKVSISIFIIPFWFTWGDLIAEVYGYNIAKKMIWYSLLCLFIFIFGCYGIMQFHSTPQIQNAYIIIFGHLPQAFVANMIAQTAGIFLNIYFLSKWGVLLHGRYFWLRSWASTGIGALIFTLIGDLIAFAHVLSPLTILKMVAVSYIIKLIFDPVAVIPFSILTSLLKKIEGNHNNQHIDFNPFKTYPST